MTLKKPLLMTTPKNLTEVRLFLDAGSDAIIIGHERYGLRLCGNFSIEEIRSAVQIAHEKDAKVYVAMNNLIHNEILAELPEYLTSLEEIHVDAIILGDPSILVIAKEVAPSLMLCIDTETTLTSADTINYWGKKGVQQAIVSRELTLEEVIEIKKSSNVEIHLQVHGMTCIFHSKRELVSNYQQYQGRIAQKTNNQKDQRLFLKEATRSDQMYPIFEDASGTHIMSTEDICMLEYVPTIMNGGIDVLKIDGILKSTDYNVEVIRFYRQAIQQYMEDPDHYAVDHRNLERLKQIQPDNRPLGTGFYFKELFY